MQTLHQNKLLYWARLMRKRKKRNDTITYAPQLTTEIQHFGICFVCIFSSAFKNNLTNVLILLFFPLHPQLLFYFLCQHWSVQLWAAFLLNPHHFHRQCKRQTLADGQTNSFLKLKCAKLYRSCTDPWRTQFICTTQWPQWLVLPVLHALTFLSVLQLVCRSYISRCGRKSTQTQGMWGFSGQRERERPWRVLHVRQVGDKGLFKDSYFAYAFCI